MSEERSYGLDIYRIMAMVMITILHVVNMHLCMLDFSLPVKYCYAGYFWEYLCFTGVNCFALLSGYLLSGNCCGYDGKWLGRVVSFWLKMILWGFFLYLVSRGIFGGNRHSDSGLLTSILLPMVGFWWYISAYFGLLIFMPLVNKGLYGCSDRDLILLAAALFVVFSVIPVGISQSGSLGLGNGYSAIWLLICYVYGAVLKRVMSRLLMVKHLNIILVAGVIASVGLPLWFFWHGVKDGYENPALFMNYISPFCVLEAVCLLVLCIQIRLKRQWVMKSTVFISANALGIYLVQTYPEIWNNFICKSHAASRLGNDLYWYFPGVVLLLCVAGIIGNIVVEKIYNILLLKRFIGFISRK